MKFGHLIERNIRNTFLEKSYTKFDQVDGYQNILEISCGPLVFTS